jgi:hypothetical protein
VSHVRHSICQRETNYQPASAGTHGRAAAGSSVWRVAACASELEDDCASDSGSIAFLDECTDVWDMSQPEQALSHLPPAWAALAVPPIELIELTRCSGAGFDLQMWKQ